MLGWGPHPDDVPEPEVPEEFEYLWLLFWDIVSSTDLTFTELRSYEALHGVRFTPLEVDVLRTLDRLSRMVQRGQ